MRTNVQTIHAQTLYHIHLVTWQRRNYLSPEMLYSKNTYEAPWSLLLRFSELCNLPWRWYPLYTIYSLCSMTWKRHGVTRKYSLLDEELHTAALTAAPLFHSTHDFRANQYFQTRFFFCVRLLKHYIYNYIIYSCVTQAYTRHRWSRGNTQNRRDSRHDPAPIAQLISTGINRFIVNLEDLEGHTSLHG